MRLDRFDLNLLVALDVLLEERNVTKASARLHVGLSPCRRPAVRWRGCAPSYKKSAHYQGVGSSYFMSILPSGMSSRPSALRAERC